MTIKLKRAYDEPSPTDGVRVLVDRVWPRGLSREALKIDCWTRDLAPSTALRKWFGHDRTKWDAFKARYFRELDDGGESLRPLLSKARGGSVTLVFGAKDAHCNNAVAIKQYIEQRIKGER